MIKFLILLVFTLTAGLGCSKPSKKQTTLNHSKKRKLTMISQENKGLLQSFKEATGIIEGNEYIITSPDSHPKLCLDGDLELYKIDDSLSVLIGDRLLVGWIKKGKNTLSYSERECDFHRTVSWFDNKNKVEASEKRVCGNVTFISKKTIEFDENTISYTIDSKLNGQRQEQISCKLEKQ